MTRLELYLGRIIKSEILYRYFCFIAIRIHFSITIHTLHTRYVDIQLFQLDNSKALDDKKVGFRYHQKSIEICFKVPRHGNSQLLKKIPCFLSFHVSGKAPRSRSWHLKRRWGWNGLTGLIPIDSNINVTHFPRCLDFPQALFFWAPRNI